MKKEINLYARIITRSVMGIALSLIFYRINEKLELGITANTFDYEAMFLTELSLVFLVISFVTLLANKSQMVYWEDVIQYRLVQPTFLSIIDVTTYIFSNLLFSVLCYIFEDLEKFAIFPFIIIILFLVFLCFKLLVSFFGIKGLKIKLENEYRKALKFRKIALQLYDMSINDPGMITINGKIYDGKVAEILSQIMTFFHGSFRKKDTYISEPLEMFGTSIQLPKNVDSMEIIHEDLMKREKQRYGKIYLRNWYHIWLYLKFRWYSRKFMSNIDEYINMRDGLIANTVKCIDEHMIADSCEQIRFLFKYKECESAFSCTHVAIEKCPIIFLNVFSQAFNVDEKERGFFYKELQRQKEMLEQSSEFAILKNNPKMKKLYSLIAEMISAEGLFEWFDSALNESNIYEAEKIYDIYLKHRKEILLKEFDSYTISDNKNEEYYNKIICNLREKEKCVLDGSEDEVILYTLKKQEYEAAYQLLSCYQQYIHALVDDELSPSGELFMIALDARMHEACANKIEQIFIEACSLSEIFLYLKEMYYDAQVDKTLVKKFVDIFKQCYEEIKRYFSRRDAKNIFMEYEERLLKPMQEFINSNQLN